MSGTKAGARKAVQTIYTKYGQDFFSKTGSLGGAQSSTGGFASPKIGKDGLTGRERASKVGVYGGKKSRRTFTEEQKQVQRDIMKVNT